MRAVPDGLWPQPHSPKQLVWPTSCLRGLRRAARSALSGAFTVVETSYVLGVFAGILLLMAAVAWTKLLRGPLRQRADGGTETEDAETEFASTLLLWAAGLSTAAALIGVAGWIFK